MAYDSGDGSDTAVGAVRIGRRHVLSADVARDIGVSDVTRRLVDFADTLRSYEVDVYDIVAMKTLLLLSPGAFIISTFRTRICGYSISLCVEVVLHTLTI